MPGSRVALVVATDRYTDPTLHGLAAASADADALAEVLGDERLGAFEVDVLRNAPSFTIAERVEGLFRARRPSDVVVLHFSCHGLKDESGELHLAATNTIPDRLASTAVDAALVNRLMGRSRAQSVVLLLDCCYGGAFERGVGTRGDGDAHVGDQFSGGAAGGGRGRVVITASSAMEYALEGTALTSGGRPAPSLFTGALTDGIRSGEADRDQDGRVGLNELYDFVYHRVRERTPNQTPSRWDFGVQGDVVIARNPRRRIIPAPLPREVLDLVEHTAAGVRLGAVDELARIAVRDNLPLAAGAALALRQLVEDDSRRVSGAAGEALAALPPRTNRSTVELGPLRVGGPPGSAAVVVEGSPLALAATVTSTDPRVRAELDGSMLSVSVSTPEPGPVHGTVTLSGPAGEASVQVTATVVVEPGTDASGPGTAGPESPGTAPTGPLRTGPPPTGPAPTPAPTGPAPTGPAPTGPPPDGPEPVVPEQVGGQPAAGPEPVVPEPVGGLPADPGRTQPEPDVALPADARPSLARVGPLVVVGSAAVAAATLLAGEHEGFVAIGVDDATGWFYLPALLALVALVGLLDTRWLPVSVGVFGGCAAWSGVFWLRVTVSGTADVGLGGTLEGELFTGVWARLVAWGILATAAGICIKRSPVLREPVARASDRRALVGGAVVLVGAALLVAVELSLLGGRTEAIPRLVAEPLAILVLSLPVALTRFNVAQRRAALVAASVYLGVPAIRAAAVFLGADPEQEALVAHSAATTIGMLVTLVGCLVGQAARVSRAGGRPVPG